MLGDLASLSDQRMRRPRLRLVLLSPIGFPVDLLMKCNLVQAGQCTASYVFSSLRGASSSNRCWTFIPVFGQRKMIVAIVVAQPLGKCQTMAKAFVRHIDPTQSVSQPTIDLEPRLGGVRVPGADIRPDFDWDTQPKARRASER
jgi:hypothetical protein